MRERTATGLMLADALAARARRAARAWWRWVTTPRPDAWADEPVIAPRPVVAEGGERPMEVRVALEHGHVVLRCRDEENYVLPHTLRVTLAPVDALKLGRSLIAAAQELEPGEVRSA